MENSEKGAKRKCTKCGTLFFDFGRFPLTCPSCGGSNEPPRMPIYKFLFNLFSNLSFATNPILIAS